MKQISTRRTRLTAAAVVAGIALVPMLSGCWSGFDAGTSVLPPSGNGLNTQIGAILIRSAVWVRSAQDPATVTLSSTLVNTSKDVPDQLIGVETNPNAFAMGITNAAINLPPTSETRTGYNATNYVNAFGTNNVPVSGYIQTTFIFKVAGRVTGSILTVPPEGFYAGITPSPSGIPNNPSVSPSPSSTTSPAVSPTPTKAEKQESPSPSAS